MQGGGGGLAFIRHTQRRPQVVRAQYAIAKIHLRASSRVTNRDLLDFIYIDILCEARGAPAPHQPITSRVSDTPRRPGTDNRKRRGTSRVRSRRVASRVRRVAFVSDGYIHGFQPLISIPSSVPHPRIAPPLSRQRLTPHTLAHATRSPLCQVHGSATTAEVASRRALLPPL